MRVLFTLLVLFSTLSAQYTSNDYDLVKTAYTKTFDKKIVDKNLNSEKAENVIAALLSIARSQDTTFVEGITALDKTKFGKYIGFTLGLLPSCERSRNFLAENIYDPDFKTFLPDFLEAYGRIGNKNDYEKLVNLLSKSQAKHLDGFPYAAYNFHQRRLIDDYSSLGTALIADLYNRSEQIQFDALFGLARTAAGDSLTKEVTKYIAGNYESLSVRNLTYALSVLRKSNEFLLDKNLAQELLHHNDWRVRTEIVRLLPKKSISSTEEIDTYFSLLIDSNPNVSRQAAISLKNLKVENSVKDYLAQKISKLLENKNLRKDVRGEMYISYASLFPQKNEEIISLLTKEGLNKYLSEVIGLKNCTPDRALELLNTELNSSKLPQRMNSLTALLSYQEELNTNEDYNKILLNELDGDESTIISLLSFSIDSTFVTDNSKILREIITRQTDNKLNDDQFAEGLTSLHFLATKIDSTFGESILNKFAASTCDDLIRYNKVQKYGGVVPRSEEYFDRYWKRTFVYSEAKVTTTDGTFTMRFLPEFAPISVGSFCYLSENHYFDNVIFHRVVPDFVAQVGDPTGTGWGGPGYTINSEFSPTHVKTAMVGMASAGPDTEGSQWFVMHNDFPHLYGRYTLFAEVIDGIEVVNQLDQNSSIILIELKKAE